MFCQLFSKYIGILCGIKVPSTVTNAVLSCSEKAVLQPNEVIVAPLICVCLRIVAHWRTLGGNVEMPHQYATEAFWLPSPIRACPSQAKWHFISDLLVIIVWLANCNQIYNKDIPILRRSDNAPFHNFSMAGNLENEW